MFPYQVAQQYIAELVVVLEYLQMKSIAHRDIKPENCLLDQSLHLKLIDFGAAKRCVVVPEGTADKPKPKLNRGTFVGTQEYGLRLTELATSPPKCSSLSNRT